MTDDTAPPTGADAPDETLIPACPKCAGEMWDNRPSKRNPRAPDFKCKDKACDGVVWPPRDANAPAGGGSATAGPPAGTPDDPPCPVCGGKMWDDRTSKRNPRAPDFKCRNKPKMMGGPGCEGIIWPPRDGEQPRTGASATSSRSGGGGGGGASPRPAARPSSGGGRAAPAAAGGSPPPFDAPPPDDRDFMGDDDLPF